MYHQHTMLILNDQSVLRNMCLILMDVQFENEEVGDCCLKPNELFFSYVMA